MEKKAIRKVLTLLLSFAVVVSCIATLGGKGETDVYAAVAKNSQYSLAGAEYQLYTDANCTATATDVNGNNALMTTDANGDVATAIEMITGNYWAKETKPGKGYLLDPAVYPITITENATTTFTSTDMPTIGRMIKLHKIDSSGEEGWKSLLGAEYTLKYYDVDPSTTDVSGLTPVRSWTFKTVEKKDYANHSYAGIDFMNDTENMVSGDDFYEAKVKAYKSNGDELSPTSQYFDRDFAYYKLNNDGIKTRILPIGVFTIEETKAPKGLKRNRTVYYGSVKQPSLGADAVTEIRGVKGFDVNVATGEVENDEEPQSVEIVIEKVVGQTGEAQPIGKAATLEGAVYNIYYDNPKLDAPEQVGTITTDAEGKGKLTKRTMGDENYLNDDLRPGTYIIEEVSAPDGFLIDKYVLKEDGTTEVINGDIDVICDYETDEDPPVPVKKTISGTDKDGQHKFLARALVKNAAVFTYTLKSAEYETETHIKKTDATTTKELPGATLQILDSDNEIVEEWESTTEEHIVYGLASGTYTLREITAPYGYDIAEDIEFTVKDNEVVNPVKMENRPIKVGTIANDDDSKSHHGVKKVDEKLVDTVHVEGLHADRKYQLKGKLWNKTKEEFVKDAEGQDLVAYSEEFTATAEDAEKGKDVEVVFTLDTSEFDDEISLVAYEYLTRTERIEGRDETNDFPGKEFPVELAKHEKPDDEDQTIHYGGIASTVAIDQKSKGHNMLGEKNAVIIDTVKYKNLSIMETYVLESELYDKTAGKLTGIKGKSKEFKPEEPDGTTTVEFKFDATPYKGHKLVAYEKLLVNKTEVDKHEDPDDEDQTVYVPELKTVAVNPENNEHIANAAKSITIKDTITYKGLVPNKPYTLKGTLQYRDGLFNQLKTVMKDGQPVTATATFTPKTESGSVEVTFVFDAVDLAGKTVVVFEDCYDGQFVVATHADPNDADQSVQIPEIGTKVGKKKGKYVIDTVKYKNLIPNKTYTIKGYFVTKSTGKKVSGSDGEITFVPTTPDGEVKVKLKPKKSGKALVAFESVYIVTTDSYGTPKETLVGEHKDIKDKAQTLIAKGTPKTGENNAILLSTAFFLAAALGSVLMIRRKRMQDR